MADFNDPFMRNNSAAAAAAAVQARTKGQNRANVVQLKLIGQSHPTGLTNNLLKLFEPRPPLEFKPPPEKRKCPQYTGMAQFVSNFAEPGDEEYQPPPKKGEPPSERRARIHQLRLEEGARKAAEEFEKYDPNSDPNVSGDPYKSLFVARLSYETSESKVKREFEAYGPIKRIRLVTDKETNKPRGYGFIEYMHTRDMKAAYKQADGRKIDNRRVLVDVERGRTVPNWRPRRLGGGLGTTRVGGNEVKHTGPGREVRAPGDASRSEEPKARDERHVERDREKSRERGRDRDREIEKSSERSHDRPKDRDHREDRHHRDRDRTRDKGRDRGRDRDRDRGRDRDKDYERERDRDRGRDRDRDRPRDKDRERVDPDRDRGRSYDREYDYDRVDVKSVPDEHEERDRNYDVVEEDDPDWKNGQRDSSGHRHSGRDRDYERHRGRAGYDDGLDVKDDQDRYDRYDQMEDVEYDRARSEHRD